MYLLSFQPFVACQVGALVQGQQAQAEEGASPNSPAVKIILPFKFLSRSINEPIGNIPGVFMIVTLAKNDKYTDSTLREANPTAISLVCSRDVTLLLVNT
ncbi:hypothetical protein DPMN_100985 [Dreissena polymorpha]|uniref:Uncharacterized protein n=1 Tax=Dreissena polymorpha TaxID=45954 RepID=A0A9D4R966_DREPO|nr:hypothetical protein DPMN_100985 [Dreissena polymorpha]